VDVEVLAHAWWASHTVSDEAEDDADCLVVPPTPTHGGAPAYPAPAIFFLTGNGHVDDREDFLEGGVDLLLRNQLAREKCFVIAPKPTTKCGLLRKNKWENNSWNAAACWALLREVLRRLGTHRVDLSRLYATGFSLGAACVWHLAAAYGDSLAAVAPMSGRSEWPGGSWRDAAPREDVKRRLNDLPIRVYHIEGDTRAGTPDRDMEALASCCQKQPHVGTLSLPGMTVDSAVAVEVRVWSPVISGAGASWELWWAKGPLRDWPAWETWGGDNHCVWYRVYPSEAWGLVEWMLKHRNQEVEEVRGERGRALQANPGTVPRVSPTPHEGFMQRSREAAASEPSARFQTESTALVSSDLSP